MRGVLLAAALLSLLAMLPVSTASSSSPLPVVSPSSLSLSAASVKQLSLTGSMSLPSTVGSPAVSDLMTLLQQYANRLAALEAALSSPSTSSANSGYSALFQQVEAQVAQLQSVGACSGSSSGTSPCASNNTNPLVALQSFLPSVQPVVAFQATGIVQPNTTLFGTGGGAVSNAQLYWPIVQTNVFNGASCASCYSINGSYITPIAGTFLISAQFDLVYGATTNCWIDINFFINGVFSYESYRYIGSTADGPQTLTTVATLAAGAVISVLGSTSCNTYSLYQRNSVHLFSVTSLTTGTASPMVNLQLTGVPTATASLSGVAGTATVGKLLFPTTIQSTVNGVASSSLYNSATGIITIPATAAGTYLLILATNLAFPNTATYCA